MTNILLEKKGLIAVATINRPKALNALNSEVLSDLGELVEAVKADADIRALVITGAGEKAFVAGADIGEMSTLTKEGGVAFGKHGNDVFRRIETLPIPTVTASAVKGAVFAAACYEKLGFRVVPSAAETRHDIIQAVELGSREGMVAFCKGIQSAAAVDSYVTPGPWAMPGYESEVIMAAGAFVQGSSIELSADGPIRPPYAVYFQGGLTWFHGKLGILLSMQKLADAGIIKL